MIKPYLKSAGAIPKQKRKRKTNYKEKLWKVFSEYIRLRDADDRGYCNCISCGKVIFLERFIEAGHYVPKE